MSLIDADTGEVVDRTPALRTSGPMTTIEVAHQCRQTEVWAGHCDDIPAIRDANAKLGAIGEYLTRTSTDGRALIAATQRRLEVRIGQLLGPASRNGGHGANQHAGSLASDPAVEDDLTPNERSQFRKMADHPDVVDAIIDDSDDTQPASRRKVLDEINRKLQAAKQMRADAQADADEFASMQPDDFDPALNKELVRQRGELTRLCRDLAAIGDPADFLARHEGHLRPDIHRKVEAARDWLIELCDQWRTS